MWICTDLICAELWSVEAMYVSVSGQVLWKKAAERVRLPFLPERFDYIHAFNESSCLGLQLKLGGKFHLKLNIGGRPIANKYREGKMKRTLKRELKSTWNCWKGTDGRQCWLWIIWCILFSECVVVYSKFGFFVCAGEALEPVWVWDAVVRVKDSNEMPLIIPSWNTDQGV